MNFCGIIAGINLFGWIGLNYYNMVFCFVLAQSVRNTLKGGLMSPIRYQLIGIIVSVSVTLIIYFTNGLGQSLNSLCAIKFSDVAPIVALTAPLILVVIAAISIYRFRTGIPKNSYFSHQSVYSYYFIYIFTVIVLQLVISLLTLIGDLNCRSSSPDPGLAAAFSMSNVATLIHPFMIAFIRYHHPAVKLKIKNILKCGKKRRSSVDIFESVMEDKEV